MAKKPICPYCNEYIEIHDAIKTYKSKRYHKKCYMKMKEESYNTRTNQSGDREKLLDAIKIWSNNDTIDSKIISQIEKMSKVYKMTYYDMYQVLKYYYEILEVSYSEIYGIGIIPNIKTKAFNYWKTVEHANSFNENAKKHKTNNFKVQFNYEIEKNYIGEDDI